MRDFYKEIGDILGAGGEDYAIIPIGDPEHENAAHTTVTTVGSGGGNGLVFTYSEARTAFDNATGYANNRQRTPILIPWNGSDEDADSPDVDFWSRDDTAGEGMSVVVHLRNLSSSGTRSIIAKDGNTPLKEWAAAVGPGGSDKIELGLTDDSAGVTIKTRSANLPLEFVQWVVSYDGRGGADAADGIDSYVDAVLDNDASFNNASYVGMENLTALVGLGKRPAGVGVNFWLGDMRGGAIGPAFTHRVLSQVEVTDLHEIGLDYIQELPILHPQRRLGGVLVG